MRTKRWLIAALVAACGGNSDYAPTKNERAKGGTWMCPTQGTADMPTDKLFCQPVEQTGPGLKGQELREYIASAPRFAAGPCMKRARAFGGTCMHTRLVVCSTHDPGELNVCFLTWDLCLKNVAEHPERSCTAYFDGEALRD